MRREVFCWKYRVWVRRCPLKDDTKCLIVNCPLRKGASE